MTNGSSPQWLSPPHIPTLDPQDVHLWRLSLTSTLSAKLRAQLWATLAPDEQKRYQRFIRSQDQQRFMAVRGGLRWLLGQYLDMDAEAIQFSYGAKGKPHLDHGDSVDLTFNLSHSHDVALIALAAGGELGVDLERMSLKTDYVGITRRFLTLGEQQVVLSQPPGEQYRTFFQLWTRKEACIKALGGSIADYLDQMDVSSNWHQTSNRIQVTKTAGRQQQLHLQNLHPAPGYAGAVATSWVPRQLHHYCLDTLAMKDLNHRQLDK